MKNTPHKKRLSLAKDKKGRVPFALAAVFILIGAIMSGAYISSLNAQRIERIINAERELKNLLAEQTTELKSFAEQSVIETLQQDTDNTAVIYEINENANIVFAELLEKNYPTEISGFKVSVSNYTMSVTTLPFEYESVNSLGMKVKMRGPVYLNAMGKVMLDTEDTITGRKMNIAVDLNKWIPITYPFMMDQTARFEYDFTEEGLITEMAEYLLDRAIKENKVIGEKGAIETAISFYEAITFRKTGNTDLHNYLNTTLKSKEKVDPYNYLFDRSNSNPIVSNNAEFVLDLSNYNRLFFFDGTKINLTSTEREFVVSHKWLNGPTIQTTSQFYTDPDSKIESTNRNYQFTAKYKIIDVNITGSLEITISETGKHQPATFVKNVEVDTHLRYVDTFGDSNLDLVIMATGYTYDINAPQIENKALFEQEFAYWNEGRGDLQITVKNAKNEEVKFDSNVEIDINLDGMYLGTFLTSPINLKRILEGHHSISVSLLYPNGTMEFGGNDIEVIKGKNTPISITTSQSDSIVTSSYWMQLSLALENIPPEERLLTIIKFISDITNFPLPFITEVKTITDLEKIEKWLVDFYSYYENNRYLERIYGLEFAQWITDIVHYVLYGVVLTIEVVKEVGNYFIKGCIQTITFEGTADVIKLVIKTTKGLKKEIFQASKDGKVALKYFPKEFDKLSKNFPKLKSILDNADKILAFVNVVLSVTCLAQDVIEMLKDGKKIDEIIFSVRFGYDALKVMHSITILTLTMFPKLATKLLAKVTIVIGIGMAVLAAIEDYGENKDLFIATMVFISEIIMNVIFVIAPILLAMGPIGWFILGGLAIAALIITIWLHWDEITAWWRGRLTEKEIRNIEDSVSGLLKSTGSIVANLNKAINGENGKKSILQYRQQFALSYSLKKAGMFTSSNENGEMYLNLANYFRDYATESLNKLRHMHYVRFWIIALWRQADDFVDGGFDIANQNGDIWKYYRNKESKDSATESNKVMLRHNKNITTPEYDTSFENQVRSEMWWEESEGFEDWDGQNWLGLIGGVHDHTWDGDIKVEGFPEKTEHIRQSEGMIEDLLLNIEPKENSKSSSGFDELIWNLTGKTEIIKKYTNAYGSTGGQSTYDIKNIIYEVSDINGYYGESPYDVAKNGADEWGKTMQSMSSELGKWVDFLSFSLDRFSYVSGFPNPLKYSRNFGLISINKDIELGRGNVFITPKTGGNSIKYLDSKGKIADGYSFSINEIEVQKFVYVYPGDYKVVFGKFGQQNLDEETLSYVYDGNIPLKNKEGMQDITVYSFKDRKQGSGKVNIAIDWSSVVQFFVSNSNEHDIQIMARYVKPDGTLDEFAPLMQGETPSYNVGRYIVKGNSNSPVFSVPVLSKWPTPSKWSTPPIIYGPQRIYVTVAIDMDDNGNFNDDVDVFNDITTTDPVFLSSNWFLMRWNKNFNKMLCLHINKTQYQTFNVEWDPGLWPWEWFRRENVWYNVTEFFEEENIRKFDDLYVKGDFGDRTIPIPTDQKILSKYNRYIDWTYKKPS